MGNCVDIDDVVVYPVNGPSVAASVAVTVEADDQPDYFYGQTTPVHKTTRTPHAECGAFGGKFELVYRQKADVFKSVGQWGSVNPTDATAESFSILKELEQFRRLDGTFELKMVWPAMASNVNSQQWRQTNNPMSSYTVTGYEEVKVNFQEHGWEGLALSTDANTLIDGTPDDDNNLYSVGAQRGTNRDGKVGILGPNNEAPETVVELYACQEGYGVKSNQARDYKIDWGLKSTRETANIVIQKGDSVIWVYSMDTIESTHKIVSGTPGRPDNKFASPVLARRGTFKLRFNETGDYNFYSDPHVYLSGTISVRDDVVERVAKYRLVSDHHCAVAGTCAIKYNSGATPLVSAVTPTHGKAGDRITVTGSSLLAASGYATEVLVGSTPCAVDATTLQQTGFECVLGPSPAGLHSVFVTVGGKGTARLAHGQGKFLSDLAIEGLSSAKGSYGGGTTLRITGAGFGGGGGRRRQRRDGAWGGWMIYDVSESQKDEELGTKIHLCGQACTVTASTYSSVTCVTEPFHSVESITSFDHVEASKLVPLRPFTSDSPGAISDGWAVAAEKNCGGNWVRRWASDGTSSRFGHGQYTDVDECKAVCDAHDDCAGFVWRASDNRCSFWAAAPILLRGQAGHSCYTKSGDPGAVSLFNGDFTVAFAVQKADTSPCYVGVGLGSGTKALISRARFFPTHQMADKANGGFFETSADLQTWNKIGATIGDAHQGWNWIDAKLAGQIPSRYVRYVGPPGSKCEMTQFEFFGVPASATSTCAVQVSVTEPLTHPSLGLMTTDHRVAAKETSSLAFTFTKEATGIIESISPKFGSSLGGERVTIKGRNLAASDQVAAVKINGKVCNVESANAAQIVCRTTARGRRDEMQPLGIVVHNAAEGKGNAIVKPSIVYRYLDRWSQVNTWLNDEPPLEGDTVIIPESQTILMDVSPPQLFLLQINGMLVFDRTKDLNLDATYIFVFGGTLEVGTELEPFTKKATITLHGDRLKTIELPFVGAKMLAVADKGGFTTHGEGRGVDVPLSQKGVIDIHGQPRLRTWTKVAKDIERGKNTIVTAQKTDFEAGEKIVLTAPHQELTVASRLDEYTFTVVESIAAPHSAEIRKHSSTLGVEFELDMRCEVALLSRNVIIQGAGLPRGDGSATITDESDERSSEEQLFGVHTGAFHGGHYRIENTELRHCGQAGNLGRYCMHYHVNDDNPAPYSYIKSNSIHHSFQRATTVHGTHHALVKNNVAYHVMGHTYFVEDGDADSPLLCSSHTQQAPSSVSFLVSQL